LNLIGIHCQNSNPSRNTTSDCPETAKRKVRPRWWCCFSTRSSRTSKLQTSQKQKNQDRDCNRFHSPTSPFSPLPPVQKTEGNGANGGGKERDSVSTSGLNQHRPLVSSEFCEEANSDLRRFRNSDFGFLSTFGIRHSDSFARKSINYGTSFPAGSMVTSLAPGATSVVVVRPPGHRTATLICSSRRASTCTALSCDQ